MAPVGERRTLKPVIIIPPQGTSSHPATHYNPFYFNAENDILYNSRTEYLSSPLYKILTHHKMIHIALRVKHQTNFLKIDFSLNILQVYFSYLRQHFQTQFAFCAYFTIVLRRILSLVIIGIDISVHGYVMNKGWPRSG